MTEIYFVRHPESVLNVDQSTIGGRSNYAPITERGSEQARRFAKAYAALYPRPDIFYSSPAVRTKSLIDIYQETNQQHDGYFIDYALQELSQGIGEGKPRDAVYTPEVLKTVAALQHNFSLLNGESLNQGADRILDFVYKAEEKHPDKTILVSTHGLVTKALIGRILGWSHRQTTIDPAHQIDNVALTHTSVKNHEVTVNFWGKDIIEPVKKAMDTVY